MSPKKQFFLSLAGILFILLIFSAFHFCMLRIRHSTLVDFLPEREYNAIIARYHDYDALIMGTSMSECFKCSEFDRLFSVNSHKLTTAGAHISEITFTADYALKYRKVKMILMDINYITFEVEKPWLPFPEEYYHDNIFFNDLRNSFELATFTSNLQFLKKIKRENSVSRDSLYNWERIYPSGKRVFANAIFSESVLPKKSTLKEHCSGTVRKNIRKYLKPLVMNHPEIKFIFYLPPYSAFAYTDLPNAIALRTVFFDEMLVFPNVEIHDFQSIPEIAMNFELYKDKGHYNSHVSSLMLQQIKAHSRFVTKENRKQYEEKFRKLWDTCDYDVLLKELRPFYKNNKMKKP